MFYLINLTLFYDQINLILDGSKLDQNYSKIVYIFSNASDEIMIHNFIVYIFANKKKILYTPKNKN